MKFEYLLFNLIVIGGPVVSHFNRQIKGMSRWRLKLLTNGIVMIPYIDMGRACYGFTLALQRSVYARLPVARVADGRVAVFYHGSVWMLVGMGNLAGCETLNAPESPSVCQSSFIRCIADRCMDFQHRQAVHWPGVLLFWHRWSGGYIFTD